MQSASIHIKHNHFMLMAQRAVLWKEQNALLIADPHFGKAASFRSHGIAIPRGTTCFDLDRLAKLIILHRPEQLVILGDLIHTSRSKSRDVLQQLRRWRKEFADLNIRLIQGNHDRISGDPPEDFKVDRIQNEYRVGEIYLSHRPCRRTGRFTISGHVHPCVVLEGKAQRQERFPCFYFSSHYAILPAFGSFTGYHRIRPTAGDRVYIVADGQIIEAPTRAAHRQNMESTNDKKGI